MYINGLYLAEKSMASLILGDNMIKLKNFTDFDFKISWTLIDIGFLGDEIFAHSLSIEDISAYVDSLVERSDNPDDLLIEFMWEPVKNEGVVESYIQKFVEKEIVSRDLELRKWHVVYVATHLKKESFPSEGLMELGEIWTDLQYPANSPHVFFIMDKPMPHDKYFSMDNYNHLYNKHLQWIRDEVTEINRIENV